MAAPISLERYMINLGDFEMRKIQHSKRKEMATELGQACKGFATNTITLIVLPIFSVLYFFTIPFQKDNSHKWETFFVTLIHLPLELLGNSIFLVTQIGRIIFCALGVLLPYIGIKGQQAILGFMKYMYLLGEKAIEIFKFKQEAFLQKKMLIDQSAFRVFIPRHAESYHRHMTNLVSRCCSQREA